MTSQKTNGENMTKLLITRGSLLTGKEGVIFRIKSENKEFNQSAHLHGNRFNDDIPYNCMEIDKKMEIQNIGYVIDLLNTYLRIIQSEQDD